MKSLYIKPNPRKESLQNILIIFVFGVAIYLFLKYNYGSAINEGFNASSEKNFIEHYENFTETSQNEIGNQIRQNAKQIIENFNSENPEISVNVQSRNQSSNQSNMVLMLFYSPSCPHCLNFLPLWEQLKELLINSSNLTLTDINCTEHKNLCRRYNIKGVPTLVFFNGNENQKYTGKRTHKEIIEFLKQQGADVPSVEQFRYYVSPTEEELGLGVQDPECYNIVFNKPDKNIFCASSRYIDGCLKVRPTDGISKFDGAYSVIASYLTSLSDPNNMKMCAKRNKNTIRNWRLCDSNKLNEIKNRNVEIEQGRATLPLDNIDYTSNNKVIEAIKKACIS
tara:strand:- start:64 stop:1077 length:1014 start_codon:yes stop_codon:yes gene_type:complete